MKKQKKSKLKPRAGIQYVQTADFLWDDINQRWGRTKCNSTFVSTDGTTIVAIPYVQANIIDTNGNAIGQTNPLPVLVVGNTEDIVAASATITAGSSGSVTLPGKPNLTTFIRGFVVSSAVVVTAVSGQISISGLLNMLTFRYTIASVGSVLNQYFGDTGIPANAKNTDIVVNIPAIIGGSTIDVVAWGYRA